VEYLYIHRIIISRQKKWGHLRTVFATSGYPYPEFANILVNIFAKIRPWGKCTAGQRGQQVPDNA